MALQLADAWDTIAGGQKCTVFLVGEVLTGHENGLVVPLAGEEPQWIRENFQTWVKRAEGGDEMYRDMVEDLRTRFKDSIPEESK